MSGHPSITNVDDDKIVDLIDAATQRVVLLAPGLADSVADAIVGAWRRLGTQAVTVILDVDPEVCRLGYGTVEALKTLRDAAAQLGTLICHQPGVRVGLLICDQTTLVFNPPPLLIEAGSRHPERPNAIQLGTLPGEVAADVGLGAHPERDRRVGMDPVTPHQIDEVASELTKAPPARFDLARRVRVFTTQFQFVELEMTGCYVSRKKVPIPAWLIGFARNDEIGDRLHAQYALLDGKKLTVPAGDGKVITEQTLRDRRQKIVRDYVTPLKGYGTVVLRANKDALIAAVAELKEELAAFERGVRQALEHHVDHNISELSARMLPSVCANPPTKYTKWLGPNPGEDDVKPLLEADLRDAFNRAGDVVPEMKVSLVLKDVAYESLVDEAFLKVAREAIPRFKSLHEEFDATEAHPEERTDKQLWDLDSA